LNRGELHEFTCMWVNQRQLLPVFTSNDGTKNGGKWSAGVHL
jgi:hypothetical protein